MTLRGLCLFAAMLAMSPAHALTVKTPDVAENGAVIPVEVGLHSPLTAGQQLEIIVNGEVAARVKVGKGKVRYFQTRVKGSRNNTSISARVVENGREFDKGSRNVRVTVPAPVTGSATAAGPIKMKNGDGSATLLVTSENGYAGTLVLSGTDLQVEITGSTSLSKNPLIGVRGDFTGAVTASINGHTTVAAAQPREDNSAAERARQEAREQQRRAEQAQMERQQAERARAQREKEAREAEETKQAWGQLADALVQYQQAKTDRKQAQYEQQQRQLQAQQEQQRRIQEQQRIAYEAEAARAEAALEAERRAKQQQASNQRSTQPVTGTVIRDRSNEPQRSGSGANHSGNSSRPPAGGSSSERRKPRPHVPDAVAVKCLTVNKDPGYGGFINSCPFSVEFTYCAYRPKKDSWTESFDCEKGKFGSWQVGANGRTAVHTKGAEKIHWVACRYSGPDGKPIGVSPMDARWDAQKRTVTFRCGEWGSGGSG